MKIDVMDYEKKYTFELEPVTQLCGQNIIKKSFILESIRRYFGSHKYKEEQNRWRDNVRVNDQMVGRKYFTVLSVSSISDILAMIKWSKQSLMAEYVKQIIQNFDWQVRLRTLHEEVDMMIQMINEDLNQLGNVELSYAMSEVWEMVQKTDIVGSDQVALEDKDSYELIKIFLNLIERVMEYNPRKMLVIFENLDHLLSRTEYQGVVKTFQNMSNKADLYFVVSASLDGYVVFDRELCQGISIFGDIDFQMPEYDALFAYIEDHYPYHKTFLDDQFQGEISGIIQKIGQCKYLNSVEEQVICKLINQTLMISDRWSKDVLVPEIAFLKS